MRLAMRTMRMMLATEAESGLQAFELPGASPYVPPPFCPISLAPGFSRVSGDANTEKPFQRFFRNGQ